MTTVKQAGFGLNQHTAGRIAQCPLRVGLLVMLMMVGFQLALHGYTFRPEMHAALRTSSR